MARRLSRPTGDTSKVKSGDETDRRHHGWRDAVVEYSKDRTWGGSLNIAWIDNDGKIQDTQVGDR